MCVYRGSEPIISVRHVHDGVGEQRHPATASGHRPVRGPRNSGVAVLPRHVDGRLRGLGLDRVPDHQRSGKVHVVHAYDVDASEYRYSFELHRLNYAI